MQSCRIGKNCRQFKEGNMAKKKKEKIEKIDGLGPDDIRKIRVAIRQVWSWSYPRRLCIARAVVDEDGNSRCELCKKVVPKVHPDHIEAAGDVDAGFISRLFCSSNKLQALCKKCHQAKTNQERREAKAKKKGGNKRKKLKDKEIEDFF